MRSAAVARLSRADARASIRRAVDAATAIGADAVLVPFFGDATIETDRHRDRVVEGVGRVADSAEAAGVTLALENTLSGAANSALLDRIGSPVVGVYYDVGNAIAYDLDPAEDLLTLGADVARVHVKDWGADGSCPIGEGEVDFEGCIDALARLSGGWDNLLFATDWPHWDFDSPVVVKKNVPRDHWSKIYHENARDVLRL